VRNWAGVVALVTVIASLSLAGGRSHDEAPATSTNATKLWHDRQIAPAAQKGSFTPGAGTPGAGTLGPGTPGAAASPSAAIASEPRTVDCRKLKCIALTFDDGPVPNTGKLLRILKAHQARVTFFLIGQNAAAYPDMARREVAEGHQVGDHSWDHSDLSALSNAAIKSQIARTQAAVKKASGVAPVVLRPPYGKTNARVAAVAREYNLAQFLWAVDPFDWMVRDSAMVERRVVNGARRDRVILMHDIQPTTVNAVPRILDRLAKKGFTFVTISELFGADQPVPGKQYTKY
jgi:peptidoglycan/xylan/chitin deacetylase (PgdA/CDA1 family)